MILVLIQNIADTINSNASIIIGMWKDVFQILFFILAGIIAVLTYLQAKKSLFTPIKTETFKLQIKALDDIIHFFQNKSETDFKEQFDFNNILALNSQILFNDYVETFFSKEIKVDQDKVKELMKNFVAAIVDREYFQKEYTAVDYYESNDKVTKSENPTNPALILKKWQDYKYYSVHYTLEFFNEEEKVKNLAASPVIPSELKNLILDFQNRMTDNLSLIGNILSEIAQELPDKFPTYESFSNFSPTGTWNRFVGKSKEVEPIAEKILIYIRHHLKIDEIVN